MQSSIDSTYQSVIEQSGIRAGDGGFAVTVAADTTLRTGDKANGIAGIFDAGKVQKEIAAQSQITQTFSTLAPKQLAAYVSDQVNEINAQLGKEDDPQRRAALLAERDRWDEGGAYRVLMHTAVGSVVGDVSGAAGAAAAAVPAPGLNDLQASLEDSLVKAGMNPTVAKGVAVNVSGLAAAGVGAAVGGATGAGVGLSVDANNRQRHLSTCERLKEGCKGRASSECQTINRIGGVRSGMPTDDAQIPASKVVENYDAIGKVVSYTLIDRKTNQPTMIMELLEFNAYRNATPRIQATMQTSPQYALDFASAGLHSAAGDEQRALEHVAVGVTSPVCAICRLRAVRRCLNEGRPRRSQMLRTPEGETTIPRWRSSFDTRTWPKAGRSSAKAATASSMAGSTRLRRFGFLRLASGSASRPPSARAD